MLSSYGPRAMVYTLKIQGQNTAERKIILLANKYQMKLTRHQLYVKSYYRP